MARADLDSARANDEALIHLTEADQGAVALAEEQIHRATLRSPIKGVVIALYVHEGEMLGSATAAVAGVGTERGRLQTNKHANDRRGRRRPRKVDTDANT